MHFNRAVGLEPPAHLNVLIVPIAHQVQKPVLPKERLNTKRHLASYDTDLRLWALASRPHSGISHQVG